MWPYKINLRHHCLPEIGQINPRHLYQFKFQKRGSHFKETQVYSLLLTVFHARKTQEKLAKCLGRTTNYAFRGQLDVGRTLYASLVGSIISRSIFKISFRAQRPIQKPKNNREMHVVFLKEIV